MSSWILYDILYSLSGNPLLAGVLMLAGGWMLEHYTLGALPTPLRFFRRWSRRSALRRRMRASPHDRKARFELADLLLDGGHANAALPLIRANAEAGDHDAQTLFLLGKACLRAGHFEQGVKVMHAALEEEPKVRQGEGWLELGRALLAHRDFAQAREALEQFCLLRSGTVEGRVLLARALAGEGEGASAAAMREQAWREYASSPRYLQRQERLWAWRVKPSRPALYAALAVGVLVLAGRALQSMPSPSFSSPYAALAQARGQSAPAGAEGAQQGIPEWAVAISEVTRAMEAGRKAPGAAALRAAGCGDVFVGDGPKYLAAFRHTEAVGYATNFAPPSSTRPTLVECRGGSSLSCDELAARYLSSVSKAPSDFTVAAYEGSSPRCVEDFSSDGKRL